MGCFERGKPNKIIQAPPCTLQIHHATAHVRFYKLTKKIQTRGTAAVQQKANTDWLINWYKEIKYILVTQAA